LAFVVRRWWSTVFLLVALGAIQACQGVPEAADEKTQERFGPTPVELSASGDKRDKGGGHDSGDSDVQVPDDVEATPEVNPDTGALAEVAIAEVSTVKKQGTEWNAKGNLVIPSGVRISLAQPSHVSRIEVSLDDNDQYRVVFRLGDTMA